MATQDFSKLYYRTANCLTSDIIADFSPVSRVLGADTSTGMGVVFTAMGTRFDMQYVAKEAFMATDSYESDTRSIDDTPVAEVMRYVRSEIIAGGHVPEAYQELTEKIRRMPQRLQRILWDFPKSWAKAASARMNIRTADTCCSSSGRPTRQTRRQRQ